MTAELRKSLLRLTSEDLTTSGKNNIHITVHKPKPQKRIVKDPLRRSSLTVKGLTILEECITRDCSVIVEPQEELEHNERNLTKRGSALSVQYDGDMFKRNSIVTVSTQLFIKLLPCIYDDNSNQFQIDLLKCEIAEC
jgi:hypothetical protein